MSDLIIGRRLVRPDWDEDKFVMITGPLLVERGAVPVIRSFTLAPWLVRDVYGLFLFQVSRARLTKDSHIWLPHRGVIIFQGITYEQDIDEPHYYKPI